MVGGLVGQMSEMFIFFARHVLFLGSFFLFRLRQHGIKNIFKNKRRIHTCYTYSENYKIKIMFER